MSFPDPAHYIRLSSLVEWRDNYSSGDVQSIARSIRRFGFNGALRVHRDGLVIAGNHSMKALRLIQEEGKRDTDLAYPPHHIIEVEGEWYVKFVDVSHLGPSEMIAYAIADNALARQAVVNDALLAEYLQQIAATDSTAFQATGYDDEALNALLAQLSAAGVDASALNLTPDEDVQEKLKRIDLIYTSGTLDRGGSGAEVASWVQVHCCLAVKSGWLYGVRSSDGVCHTAEKQEAHHPQFIDNHYHRYDHAQHLAGVKRWRPKYATVRDVMSKAQCKAAGIDYYPFEQILDFAAEIAEFAENVIVIPKIDVLDKIPAEYMLGYSVPTSYGGTPLPIEAFAGRRVHLLGGSPKRQIKYFQALPDDVVSLDNNYILKVSQYARFFMLDGTMKSLSQIGLTHVTNPLYLALALNFGTFAAYFNKPDFLTANLLSDEDVEGHEDDYAYATP